MRCADFGPTPGQPTELVDQRLHHAFVGVHGLSDPPRPPSIEPRSMPPVTAPSFSRLQLLRLARRLDDRRDDEIFERLDVVGIDDARIDLDRAQLAVAGDRRPHDPAADRRVDRRVRERLLRGLHVGLHLLHLLEHVHRVRGRHGRPPSSAPPALVDDLRAEAGDEPRDGIGLRRVGRVGELGQCRRSRRRRARRFVVRQRRPVRRWRRAGTRRAVSKSCGAQHEPRRGAEP